MQQIATKLPPRKWRSGSLKPAQYSSLFSGGTRPSMPASRSSSVMRSKAIVSSSRIGVGGGRGGVGLVDQLLAVRLGLVDFDVLLQRMDQVFLEIVRRERLVGDLAQRHHRVLVVVAVDGDLRALRDLPRAVAGQQHEFKAIVDLVDAIFNGYAGHERPFHVTDVWRFGALISLTCRAKTSFAAWAINAARGSLLQLSSRAGPALATKCQPPSTFFVFRACAALERYWPMR